MKPPRRRFQSARVRDRSSELRSSADDLTSTLVGVDWLSLSIVREEEARSIEMLCRRGFLWMPLPEEAAKDDAEGVGDRVEPLPNLRATLTLITIGNMRKYRKVTGDLMQSKHT